MENYFFLENYGTSEGAVYRNFLDHQPLPITRPQVRFYANNYFESLPMVSTAFKGHMYFFLTKKHNVHRFTLNLHSLKIMIVESFP